VRNNYDVDNKYFALFFRLITPPIKRGSTMFLSPKIRRALVEFVVSDDYDVEITDKPPIAATATRVIAPVF